MAEQHYAGQKFRFFNRWTQFGAMIMGQMTGRRSLRDIVANMSVHSQKFYHLGLTHISRATLARTNEKQPASLYETIFYRLLKRCWFSAPGNRFKLKNLYLLDSSTIDLVFQFSPGLLFARPREPLNSIPVLMLMVTCRHLLI